MIRNIFGIGLWVSICTSLFSAGEIVLDFKSYSDRPILSVLREEGGGFYGIVGGEINKFTEGGAIDSSFEIDIASVGALFADRIASDKKGNLWVISSDLLTKVDGEGRLVSSFNNVRITRSNTVQGPLFNAIASDDLGGCYIAGSFVELNGQKSSGLAYIRPDGTIVESGLGKLINAPSIHGLHLTAKGLLVTEDSKIYFLNPSTGARTDLHVPNSYSNIRIGSSDYSPDWGFIVSIGGVVNQRQEERLYHYDQDGVRDESFDSSIDFGATPLRNIRWDDSGRIFGINARIGSEPDSNRTDDYIAFGPKRFLSDGRYDPTWSRLLDFDLLQGAWCQLSDGSYIVSGVFSSIAGINVKNTVKLKGTTSASQNVQQSTRTYLNSTANSFVMGVVIPDGGTSVELVLRAASGSLERFGQFRGVFSTRLRVYDVGGSLIKECDAASPTVVANYYSKIVGAFPLDDGAAEARCAIVLVPGIYTFVVDSYGDEGDLLGEVYFR